MPEESPTVEEPQVEETQPEMETENTVDIDGLMNELQAAQIDSPEKLKGHITNARNYHQMQSERDRLAQELNAMRAEFAEIRETARKPQQNYDEYAEQGQPVDLESAIAKAIRKERAREQQQQIQAQQHIAKVWNKINGHKYYNLVKDDFEGALRDPVTAFKLQTGELDAQELYYNMVTEKFGNLTRRTVDALKQLKGAGTVAPPHIEGSARVGTQNPDERTDKQKKIDSIMKKPKNKIVEQDIDDIIGTALGDIF